MQIASVLVPGVLLLVEIGLLISGTNHPLVSASQRTAHRSGWVLTFAALVVLIWAIVIGLVGRSIAWVAFTWDEARRIAEAQAPRPVPTVLAELDVMYGGIVAPFIASDDRRRAIFDDTADFNGVREYCKGWLRTYAPGLSIDGHEIEIAFIVAAAAPGLVLPFTVARYFGVGWGLSTASHVGFVFALVGSTLTGAVIALLCYKRARTRRSEEVRDAIRNYCSAHWYADDPPGNSPGQVAAPATRDARPTSREMRPA